MRTRTRPIQIYLSEEELSVLDACVRRTGLTRSAYIRQIIRGRQPKELPPADFLPMMRHLYYCGNSLNQIARKANALHIVDAQKYDEAVELFRCAVRDIYQTMVEAE